MNKKVNVFWFRRDLRLDDNVGFLEALKGAHPVLPVFIFDSEITEKLSKDDARITFIHQTLQKMRKELEGHNSSVAIYQGTPIEIFAQLLNEFDINAVYTNRDYEPYAKERDEEIEAFLASNQISFFSFKDQVIFEKNDILKDNGDPYVVYTPYMKRWKLTFKSNELKVHSTSSYLNKLIKKSNLPNLSLEDIGFKSSLIKVPDYNLSSKLIEDYEKTRNYPVLDATSHLGPHLRFGTVGIRTVVKKASAASNKTFLQELIWREFFMHILYHYPHTVTDAFKKKYDRINWRNNQAEFEQWKEGKTGYPMVDAGMRQLKITGFLHNRVRMLVGSFLCKHLLIDWRWGEAYFAENLLDYEMASNVGNWQWVAGSGVDAAPYFRIFNPTTQMEDYDKNREYIKTWIEEFETHDYPAPMVDHKEARERALAAYKAAVSQ